MILLGGSIDGRSPEDLLADLEAHLPADCAVQLFDARYVAGREHLASAVGHANRAVARNESVARERAVEILLFAAGRRQIDEALEMGVKSGRHAVVGVLDAGAPASATTDADAPSLRTPLSPEWVGPPTQTEREGAGRIVAGTDLAVDWNPGVGDRDLLQEYFEIGDRELAATTADIPALVRERVALLDIEK